MPKASEQHNSIAMNKIETLQDATAGQRTLAYAREDAAADKFANAQPKC